MEADKGIWKITKGKQNRIYINCSDESQVMHPSDPKKYAEDLVEKMRLSSLKISKKDAVNCALISVEEIIKTFEEIQTYKDVNPNLPIGYYKSVKTELENK